MTIADIASIHCGESGAVVPPASPAKDAGVWVALFHLGDSHYLWTSPLGQSYLVRPEPLEPP